MRDDATGRLPKEVLDMKLSTFNAVLVAAAVTGQPALAQSPKAADKTSQTQPAVSSPAEFDKQLAPALDDPAASARN
jgi:hypothetical protein